MSWDGNWSQIKKPRVKGNSFLWSGSRPFLDKSLKGLTLKLGDPFLGLYFQFYSHNGGAKHFGKTKLIHFTLNEGSKNNQNQIISGSSTEYVTLLETKQADVLR